MCFFLISWENDIVSRMKKQDGAAGMIIAYLVPGIIASFALILYVALMLLLLNAFDLTLTLPGIAGIILSIGMRPEKQKEKARETMDIYAPIAQRLGISKIKIELDDLALKYWNPEVYADLVAKIDATKMGRQAFVDSIVKEVAEHISAAHIRAEVSGRVKHYFSIYKKMVNQDKTIDQIYDLFAVRIIVDTVKDCYAALGVIHGRDGKHSGSRRGRFDKVRAGGRENYESRESERRQNLHFPDR